MTRTHPLTPFCLAVLMIAGCIEGQDQRLVRLTQESTELQAEQNHEIVRLNREIAEGTHRLVEADSQSRRELLALQQELQREQVEIGRQRDRLDEERKELAQARQRDSVLAAVLYCLGELTLCGLPLILRRYLLHNLRREAHIELVEELLIEEIAAEPPRLLPPEPGLPSYRAQGDENALD